MSDERGDLTPQEMDELASAYLDGEATPEEAALVESDARMQALVEELRAVRDLMAAPVEGPSDEVRDQMIAQALNHRAPVVSMDTARRRLRAIPPQARVILAAAAVIAAIAVVGVTIFERQGDEFAGDDDSASAPAMDDGYAADSPSEDSGEPEPMMADELEVAPTSGEALLVFETAAELGDYALLLAEELIGAQDTERLDETTDTDLMGCPLFHQFPVEGRELLTRFDALVDEFEVQVSLYLAESDLQLIESTPPPECALHNEHIFFDWLE
ncbi:MAG: hypothetical protein OXG30_01170 [bacterium]|nr:hypothetical protein [bacterium]